MMPLPKRHLTSLMMRYNGSSVLIDCGEGTQIAIKEKGWSFNPIDIICFTHYHADHISGLPGLLLTMGNADRTKPVTMIGPRGLKKVVNSLRVVAPELPFEIKFIELEDDSETIGFDGFEIDAFRVSHNVTCYGYSMRISRAGKFDAERAKKENIPLSYWSRLQKGETITDGERTYTPDMVLGSARRGIKVTYCTDSRPTDSIVRAAQGADLFICEGMYGEDDKIAKAKQYKHMTFAEAARIAAAANPKPREMWLTHYSPSLVRPGDYIEAARKIFPAVKTGSDKKSVTLKFEDD